MHHAAPRHAAQLPVWTQSLGCPKNRVDTEHVLGSLGIPVKSVEHMGRARLVLINTCGFIAPAVSESIRAVLDAAGHIASCKRKPLLHIRSKQHRTSENDVRCCFLLKLQKRNQSVISCTTA